MIAHTPPSIAVAPILPTLTRLAVPNIAALASTVAVSIAETVYVGRLGTSALAGLAVALPFAVLQISLSSGALGGAVSSTVGRALGAGDERKAQCVTWYALGIGLAAGLIYMTAMLTFGPSLYALLGADGAALEQAVRYSNALYMGSAPIWMANLLISVLRGSGNMASSAKILMSISALQLVLGAVLGLGAGFVPRMGMVGVALGQVLAYGIGLIATFYHLRPDGAAKARLRASSAISNPLVINNILKVGAVSCVGPIQTNLTIMIITAAVARFGQEALAGYGIGARLEMLLVNIAFGVGIASVPMVAGALGAGMVSRAYAVAWSAGALGAAVLGAIGVTIAFAPSLWSALFTDSGAVIAASNEYLSNAGWGYGFFGMGLCLFFASQGLGHVMGTVFAGTLRLLTTILGAWWLAARGGTSAQVFTLVASAMTVYGIAATAAVGRLHWRDRSMRRAAASSATYAALQVHASPKFDPKNSAD